MSCVTRDMCLSLKRRIPRKLHVSIISEGTMNREDHDPMHDEQEFPIWIYYAVIGVIVIVVVIVGLALLNVSVGPVFSNITNYG